MRITTTITITIMNRRHNEFFVKFRFFFFLLWAKNVFFGVQIGLLLENWTGTS